jgi:archaetidylinositol phosphate synthase
MREDANFVRVNNILLGWFERPALQWLAAHSPRWMTPDRYTAVGILGSVTSFAGYIFTRFHPAFFWLATLGFLLNWFGDSLDGTLARYRHIERPIYGFFSDHVIDVVSVTLFFLGLGLSPYVNFSVASLTLIAFLMVFALVFLRTCVLSEFRISYGMLGATEARALAILLNTAMFFFGPRLWPVSLGAAGNFAVNPYDLCIGAIGVVLLIIFVTTAWQESARLAKAGR